MAVAIVLLLAASLAAPLPAAAQPFLSPSVDATTSAPLADPPVAQRVALQRVSTQPTAAPPIPRPAVPTTATSDAWTYRVRPGDNLYDLARAYLRPSFGWQPLQQLNGIANPMRLPPDTLLRLPIAWLKPEATVARVAFLRGQVSRERGAETTPLAIDDELAAGDALITGPDAEVTLLLADRSRLLVSSDSRLRIDRLLTLGASGAVDAELTIEGGEADMRVTPQRDHAPRFRVKTPQVTLGVRGTDFRVRVGRDGALTHAEVADGRVAAQAEERIANKDGAVRSPPTRLAMATIDAGEGVRRAAGETQSLRPQPLAAPPDLSALPARIERLPLDFSWAGAPGARYRAQVFTDATLEKRLLDGRFDGPRARWSDLPDGHYVLTVRAIDATGLEGLTAQRAFELNARPEPPFLAEPAPDARVYGEAARFVWSRSAAAARYRLQVSASPDFTAPLVVDVDDLTEVERRVPLAPGRWHWRVASIAADGEQGPWGDAAAFELRPVPPGPTSLAPSTGEDGRRIFRWGARQPGDQYDVQLAAVDGGGNASAFDRPLSEQRTERPEIALDVLPPGSYALRVRTIDADGFAGPYGTPQGFEVPRPLPFWGLVPVLGALLLIL